MARYIVRINDKHYTPHLPPLSLLPNAPPSPDPACCFTIKPGSTTRPTTYETSDTGQQVNLLAPYLSDPTIHLAIVNIFHLWCIFFCHHPAIHPSTFPSIYPYLPSLHVIMGCYEWIEGFMSVCIYEGEKRTKERERLEKFRRERRRAVSNYKIWCRVKCVSVTMLGCPSHQLASLNSVIEMTNRAAFFGFLQQLKLDILSLASHSWSPRPWNWIWLRVHSWSDSMLVLRLFLLWCLWRQSHWQGSCAVFKWQLYLFIYFLKFYKKRNFHAMEKPVDIQHHSGNCFLLTSLYMQSGVGNFIFPKLKPSEK